MGTIDAAADPSQDLRDRIAAASGIRETVDKIWFHKTAAAVIDAGRCIRCGTCIAACPSRSIGLATDGLPTLVRMCTGCSACWDFCPLGGLRVERLQRRWYTTTGVTASEADNIIGPVRAAYAARARERAPGAQDGGVVTALVASLLGQGCIHGVLLSHHNGPFRGQTVLATTPEAARHGAGSVYDQSYPLAVLADGFPTGIEKVALVGTPCQISGLRALQLFPWRYRATPVQRITLTIALFCTRSFDPIQLVIELTRQGLDPGRVARVDIRDGRFRAHDGTGRMIFETRIGALRHAALRGCDECADFTGVLADIAVGNVGSPPGWTTVLIRTEQGAAVWERARSVLEVRPLDNLRAVAEQATRNHARAVRALQRGYDPDGALWVRYSEHLAAYCGTERAPVAPPSHRSHHYTVSC
jgi:coenzyme F420 hydrogenase subunit beta